MIDKSAVRSESVIPHFNLTGDYWLVISFVRVPVKYAKPFKPLLEGGGGRIGGHMYDKERCSEKEDSVIPHFHFTRDGWFVISFIFVPTKNHKLL